jgi:amidase
MTRASTGLDAFAPAHAMLAGLRERPVSAAELVELHLQHIERYNAALKAIVVPADNPQVAARRADGRRRDDDSAAPVGLPVTLKESTNVEGMPTTVGVQDFASFRAADFGAIPKSVYGSTLPVGTIRGGGAGCDPGGG